MLIRMGTLCTLYTVQITSLTNTNVHFNHQANMSQSITFSKILRCLKFYTLFKNGPFLIFFENGI